MFVKVRSLVLIACGVFLTSARADEIDVSKVPESVRKAADDAVKSKTSLKNVKWTAADKYAENKEDKYELEGEDPDEYGVTVTITAAGKAEQVQEQVDFEKLPATVLKAFRDTVPGLKEDEAEVYKTYSGVGLADVSYELEGEDGKGRYVWLDSSPDGKIDEFYTEVGLKDLPKAVQDEVNKRFPKRKSATCYVVHEKGKLARYDIEVVRVTGAEVYVTFGPDGKEQKN